MHSHMRFSSCRSVILAHFHKNWNVFIHVARNLQRYISLSFLEFILAEREKSNMAYLSDASLEYSVIPVKVTK
jgi:hypothetical protein